MAGQKDYFAVWKWTAPRNGISALAIAWYLQISPLNFLFFAIAYHK